MSPPGPYLGVRNPLTPEHSVLRRSLLSSVLGIAERNSRTAPRQCLFEIGPVFLPREGEPLPEEPLRLAIVMTGRAYPAGWDRHQKAELDFYDLKGVIETTLCGAAYPLHPFPGEEGTIFHPGKCAAVFSGETRLGIFGELHPLVQERFDLGTAPSSAPSSICKPCFRSSLPALKPPGYRASRLSWKIWPSWSKNPRRWRGGRPDPPIRRRIGQLGAPVRRLPRWPGRRGKKSLAYSITYQASDRTLTDGEAAEVGRTSSNGWSESWEQYCEVDIWICGRIQSTEIPGGKEPLRGWVSLM